MALALTLAVTAWAGSAVAEPGPARPAAGGQDVAGICRAAFARDGRDGPSASTYCACLGRNARTAGERRAFSEMFAAGSGPARRQSAVRLGLHATVMGCLQQAQGG